MSSTCWRLLEEVQKRLQAMSFEPQGGDRCPPINPRNIVVYKPGLASKDGEDDLSHIATPGLIVTPPRTITSPADAGTNARDDVMYPLLVQLVDTDGQERIGNFQSYAKWLQQIRHACHARSWPEIEINKYGDVRASFAEVVNVVDTKAWKRMPKFVAGVAIVFTVREQRGIET